MATLTEERKKELRIAQARVDAGTPGAATDTNAGDIANIAFAKSEFGFDASAPPGSEVDAFLGLPSPNPPANLISNTDDLRAAEGQNKTDATGIITDLDETKDDIDEIVGVSADDGLDDLFSQTEEGKESSEELKRMRQSLGITTSEEERRIAEAGTSAAAEFDSEIRAAEEAKRKGLPIAKVKAGERGGFLNTQFAGIAALLTTEGGDFFGEGGILASIKSDFDRIIADIRTRSKLAAIQARQSARKAIRTGKKEDLGFAQDAFDQAQRLSKDAIDLAQRKIDTISDATEARRKGITFDQAQIDRKSKIATDRLNNIIDTIGVDGILENRAEVEQLFSEARFEGIEFDDIVEGLKKKEEEAIAKNFPKPQVRTIGKQLFSVIFNPKTEQFETELLLTAASTSRGNGLAPGVIVSKTNQNKINQVFGPEEGADIIARINEGGVLKFLKDFGNQLNKTELDVIEKAFGVKADGSTDDDRLKDLGFSAAEIRAYKNNLAGIAVEGINESFPSPKAFLTAFRAAKKKKKETTGLSDEEAKILADFLK